MTMDKATRSTLQNATQAARRLLEEDFDQQLEGIYDILPDGGVLDAPGAHLDAHGRLLRNKLVAALGHYRQRGLSPQAARAMLLREAAFTTLNRFAALKLLEARKVIREPWPGASNPAASRNFARWPPGLVALPDKGYRLYIECIFDEVGREVRVLFDRREVAGILWPRPPALAGLLDILNSDGSDRGLERGRNARAGSTSISTAKTNAARCATHRPHRGTAASWPYATSSSPRAMWWPSSPTTPWGGSGMRCARARHTQS